MATKRGGNPKGYKARAGGTVANIASRAGATKKEGWGVVNLARRAARGAPGANAARKTIYQEGRTIRKESGKAAAFAFNKAIAQVERNARLRQKAAAKRKPIGRKPL